MNFQKNSTELEASVVSDMFGGKEGNRGAHLKGNEEFSDL